MHSHIIVELVKVVINFALTLDKYDPESVVVQGHVPHLPRPESIHCRNENKGNLVNIIIWHDYTYQVINVMKDMGTSVCCILHCINPCQVCGSNVDGFQLSNFRHLYKVLLIIMAQ